MQAKRLAPITRAAVCRDLVPLTKDKTIATRDPLATAAYRRSARYVAQRMEQLGLEPNGDLPARGRRRYLESFFWESRFGKHTVHQSWNVRGVLRGTPRADGAPNAIIKVVGHLDNLSREEKKFYKDRDGRDLSHYEGANDNASSVAADLAIARALMARGPLEGIDVEFDVYSAEEDGLKGSEARAREHARKGELGRILGVVNFEMVGFPELLLYTGGSEDRASKNPLLPLAQQAARARHVHLTPGLSRDAGERWWFRSDHFPYSYLGVPTVMVLGNPPEHRYHLNTDTLENLDPQRVAQAARVGARLVVDLAAHASSTPAGKRFQPPEDAQQYTGYAGKVWLGTKRPA